MQKLADIEANRNEFWKNWKRSGGGGGKSMACWPSHRCETGTGKTTTINTLIHYFASEGLERSAGSARTGREQPKRMTEATGYEAQTIHRLLEISGVPEEDSAGYHFERNMENPLEADVIIIDEMSMVDLFLMHALLSAVSVGTRLIMVGDVNQLPSVRNLASVLKDIILNCGVFSGSASE